MKRRSVLIPILSLALILSLLSAPALADKGKEPQAKGKQESGQSAAYEAGFAVGQTVARVTAVCIAVVAVGGVVIGVVCRSRRSGGMSRETGSVAERRQYYRPAAKGENCGHMPEPRAGEEAPLGPAPAAPVFAEEASPWPRRPAEEAPPAPMEEPAPVHPALGENPFAAFDEFFGGYPAAEEIPEIPEEPEDGEPGEVKFKI